jgi:SAM-dependent methyltransferase
MCRDCRHVFFEEIPTIESIATYYAERYTSSHNQLQLQESARSYLHGHADALLAELKARGLPPRVADFGSSYPIFADEARKAGFEQAVSVEPSEEAAAWGAARGLDVRTPDAFPAAADAGGFGLLRFSHCLEHLPDPLGVLKAASAALAPGGMVYITQPSFPVCQTVDVDVLYADSVYPEHIHQFCALSLRRLVELAGFEITTFFCFQNEEKQALAFAGHIDAGGSKVALRDLEAACPSYVAGLGGWPLYLGENSVLHAALRR